jgi:hypothetical protein
MQAATTSENQSCEGTEGTFRECQIRYVLSMEMMYYDSTNLLRAAPWQGELLRLRRLCFCSEISENVIPLHEDSWPQIISSLLDRVGMR